MAHAAGPQRRAIRALLAAAACLLGLAAQAQPYREGEHYTLLEPPRAVESDAKVEVIEFFYYGCPVCYEAEPLVVRWLATKAGEVRFLRVPAVPNDRWAGFARTYYALEAIGELARLNWPLYDNHHFDGRRLDEEDKLLEWLAGNGVDAARFREIRDSTEVAAKVAQAKKMLEDYGIKRVPTFIVGGRYVTSARDAGTAPEMMKVVDFLVDRARQTK
ncbi:MAG: thiol:disulfide interchange protein DsbA/DsbL [Burkholderiales bacterium]|nr:thiol:disulfide interchange protein DsbA/DsbL [Burkholderiales bacterium]